MGKEKHKKIAGSTRKKTVVSAEEKAKVKASLKALKAEKDAAIIEGDKRKLKAVRFKLKKTNRQLRGVTVPPPEPKAEASA